MFWRLLDKLVSWWMKRCPHLPEHVAADLLEGAGEPHVFVKYCRRCGSVKVWAGPAPWRTPEPTWYPIGSGH